MAIVFRLSRIGNALPTHHLYPLGHDEHLLGKGAQCFRSLRDAALELLYHEMVENPDRLLLIRLDGDVDDYPHDESGWVIVQPRDVVEVRSLMLEGRDLIGDFETDEEAWEAAEPISVEWVQTLSD